MQVIDTSSQENPTYLEDLNQFLPMHQSRQRLQGLRRALNQGVRGVLISQLASQSQNEEIQHLAGHILKWQSKIQQENLPSFLKNPVQIHAAKSAVTLKSQVGLYRNKIHTVGDALSQPQVVAASMPPLEARSLMSDLTVAYGTLSDAPSAEEIQKLANDYYDPSEENDSSLKAMLDTPLSVFYSYIPAFSDQNYMIACIDNLKITYQSYIAEAKNITKPRKIAKIMVSLRDIVSPTYQTQLEEELQEYQTTIKDSQSTAEDKKDAQDNYDQISKAKTFIDDIYVKYKHVGKSDKIMSSLIKDNSYYISVFSDDFKKKIFSARIYFVYEIFEAGPYTTLSNIVTAAEAQKLKDSVLSDEKEQFRHKYGSDTLSFFTQELLVDTFSTYKSWIPTLCYYFGDNQVQKQFKEFKPTDNQNKLMKGYEYMQYFIDLKDNEIAYTDKDDATKQLNTTFASFFRRLGVVQCIATMSDPKYNTQQNRVASNKDKAEKFMSKFVSSPEGNAVMTNLRSRSLAYYFQNDSKLSQLYKIKYRDGNITLFNTLSEYIKEPKLLLDVSHTLLPDYDTYSTTDLQAVLGTAYQSTIVKFQILNPNLTLKECEAMFQPIAVQMVTEFVNKNSSQVLADGDKSIQENRNSTDQAKKEAATKADEQIKKSITDMIADMLKNLNDYINQSTFPQDAKKELEDLYQRLHNMTKLGSYTLMLASIANICTQFNGFIIKTATTAWNTFRGFATRIANFFKSSLNKLAKVVAVLGFALTLISVSLLGGAMNLSEILGIASQLTSMFGEFCMTRLPRLIERFIVWRAMKSGTGLTGWLGKLFNSTKYIKMIGQGLKIVGNLLQALVCLYLAYQASNAAKDAEEKKDYLARNLYQAASLIYTYAAIFFIIGVFPGAQVALVIGSVLMFIATILEALAKIYGDTAVTSFLKWALDQYPDESKKAGLVLK